MSYDFSLKLPKALQSRRRKDGSNPEAEARMTRVCDALRRSEPDIVFDDEDGFLTAHSTTLGDVFIEANRVSLAMSMGSEPLAVYGAIHGLMGRLHGEDYVASDPQIDTGTVEYRESFAEFMQQYRQHFDCPDGEFERWCLGEIPPEWAERAEQVRIGAELAARVFPPDEDLTKWQGDSDSLDATWQVLQTIISEVNRRIEQHSLGAYLQKLAHRHPSIMNIAPRRHDGTIYPSQLDAPWFERSLMRHEQHTLMWLRTQGYARAVQPQPQMLSLLIPRPWDLQGVSDEWGDLIRSLYEKLEAANIAHPHVDGVSTIEYSRYDFFGPDADAMLAGVWPTLIARFPDAGSIRRYGGIGAREVTTGTEFTLEKPYIEPPPRAPRRSSG